MRENGADLGRGTSDGLKAGGGWSIRAVGMIRPDGGDDNLVLPPAATLFGSGEPIRDMASMVGWGTFTTEHLLFGLILGLTALPLGSRTFDVTTPTSAARPEPTRTRERVG